MYSETGPSFGPAVLWGGGPGRGPRPQDVTWQRSRLDPARRGKKKASSKRKAKSPQPSVRAVLRHVFDGHGHDVWGLAFIVVGIVTFLGLYSGRAGPIGQALADLAELAVGRLSFLVPPLLDRARGRADARARAWPGAQPGTHTRALKPLAGSLLLIVAVAGLLHLLGGSPPFGSSAEAFGRAGGYLGAAHRRSARGHRRHVGRRPRAGGARPHRPGAVLTDTTLGTVAGRTADGMKPTTSALRAVAGVDVRASGRVASSSRAARSRPPQAARQPQGRRR